MKKILILSVLALITGCGAESGLPGIPEAGAASAGEGNAAPTLSAPNLGSGPEAPEPPVTVPLTVYSKTRTEAPINGWVNKTYTATGYCTERLGNTYCWDDGMKTLDWTYNHFHYGPYTYSYFGVNQQTNGGLGYAHGGMDEDALAEPTLMTIQITNIMAAGGVSPHVVLTTGTQSVVLCTEEETGELTCPGFTIPAE